MVVDLFSWEYAYRIAENKGNLLDKRIGVPKVLSKGAKHTNYEDGITTTE